MLAQAQCHCPRPKPPSELRLQLTSASWSPFPLQLRLCIKFKTMPTSRQVKFASTLAPPFLPLTPTLLRPRANFRRSTTCVHISSKPHMKSTSPQRRHQGRNTTSGIISICYICLATPHRPPQPQTTPHAVPTQLSLPDFPLSKRSIPGYR